MINNNKKIINNNNKKIIKNNIWNNIGTTEKGKL